ncbi:MAG: hypothetical protein KDA75_08545 [Planctomycetaceae bacterium]|nr:hypothetical protein [Planctomycetaceae bacterium]
MDLTDETRMAATAAVILRTSWSSNRSARTRVFLGIRGIRVPSPAAILASATPGQLIKIETVAPPIGRATAVLNTSTLKDDQPPIWPVVTMS